MKQLPYIAAGLITIATITLWASSGFHTGWTQTNIPVTGTDEITGIEYTTYEDGFVAGIDILASGLGLALAIVVITFGIKMISNRQ